MGRLVVLLLVMLSTTSFKISDKTHKVDGEDLLGRIELARQMLEDQSVQLIKGTIGTRRVRVGRRKYQDVPVTGIVAREMAIAVMDQSGDIRVGRAIKRDQGLEVLTPDISLMIRRENGINSDIACLNPVGGKVLAVKYPVSNEGNRFGAGEPVIQAVYTPFSPELKSDHLIRRGIEVQGQFISRAFERLKVRGVYSRAFPGQKVVDVIPTDVLTVLLMNEHIDPGYFRYETQARSFVEQVLTIIATNEEKAYSYSVSSAGARGLVQMIPSTYSLISNRYPTAGLIEDFKAGMCDPVNAIMAQVLLCDADWQAIRTRSDIPASKIGPYLAAAYNGGVGRVLSILTHDETDWMESPDLSRRPTKTVTQKVRVKVRTKRGKTRTAYVLKSYAQPIFRSETSKYVSQYHWINDVFVAKQVKGFKTLDRQ